jgi:signal transduction histidine kinase
LRQFESRTDLAVQGDLEDVGKPESQALLYRAARELLTNVGKHAKATTVRIGLMRRGDRIVLTITDDGIGFDPRSWRSTSPTATSGLARCWRGSTRWAARRTSTRGQVTGLR